MNNAVPIYPWEHDSHPNSDTYKPMPTSTAIDQPSRTVTLPAHGLVKIERDVQVLNLDQLLHILDAICDEHALKLHRQPGGQLRLQSTADVFTHHYFDEYYIVPGEKTSLGDAIGDSSHIGAARRYLLRRMVTFLHEEGEFLTAVGQVTGELPDDLSDALTTLVGPRHPVDPIIALPADLRREIRAQDPIKN